MIAIRRFSFIAITTIIISLLSACGSNTGSSSDPAVATTAPDSAVETTPETENSFRLLTDAMGHEVEVPNHPQRIIAPFIEDPLTALGLKPVAQWGAGGKPQHYLQEKLSDVPVLNMSGGLKMEETLSYSPDLIIFLAPNYMAAGSYEEFAKIAPTFVLSDNDSDWKGNLTKLGVLLNEEDAAKKAIDAYEDKLNQAKQKLSRVIAGKSAVLLQPNDEKGFQLFGPGFYGGSMLYDTLGFVQPALLKGDYESYSIESLEQLADVDYIFILSGEGRAKPPTDNPLWKNLSAVKAGNVFNADSGHWFNSNPIANGLMIDDVLLNVHE